MNLVRSLKFGIIGLVVLTVVLLVLSLHTLITGLSGAISDDTFGLKLDKNNSTGDWLLTLDANPRNNAFIDMRLFVEIQITAFDGEYIAGNSTLVYISPGSRSPFSLIIVIPRDYVDKYKLDGEQGAPVWFEMKFGIRTLGDLVGFTQTMRISGEPPI